MLDHPTRSHGKIHQITRVRIPTPPHTTTDLLKPEMGRLEYMFPWLTVGPRVHAMLFVDPRGHQKNVRRSMRVLRLVPLVN